MSTALRFLLALIAALSVAVTAAGIVRETPSVPGPICFTLAVGFLALLSGSRAAPEGR